MLANPGKLIQNFFEILVFRVMSQIDFRKTHPNIGLCPDLKFVRYCLSTQRLDEFSSNWKLNRVFIYVTYSMFQGQQLDELVNQSYHSVSYTTVLLYVTIIFTNPSFKRQFHCHLFYFETSEKVLR